MALLWIEGFDWLGTTDDVAPVGLNYRYSSTSLASTMRVDASRTGSGKSLRMTNGSARFVTTPTLGTIATVVIGFGFKYTSTPIATTIASLLDGAILAANIRLTASGELEVRNSGTLLGTTSGVSLVSGQWCYIELKVTTANSGSYELRVNGVNVLSASGVDTQPSSNAYITNVSLQLNTGGFQNFYFDDFYILDNTGSVNNDFLGPRKIVTIFPSAEGDSSDFTPLSGTNNAAMVDENPVDDDTTYVESSTTSHKDLYVYGDITGLGSIDGLQVTSIAKVTDANPFTLKTLAKSGTTESADAGQVVGSTSYLAKSRILQTNPDTAAAWTPSEVNGAQFGVEVG